MLDCSLLSSPRPTGRSAAVLDGEQRWQTVPSTGGHRRPMSESLLQEPPAPQSLLLVAGGRITVRAFGAQVPEGFGAPFCSLQIRTVRKSAD
jgi:hypothetical protein